MEELRIENFNYNENILRILISSIDRILVYWNISKEYNDYLKKIYGEDFFDKTKEVLILKNLTNNTDKRIELTEYTNNYYVKYNYSNAIYQVELVRIGKEDNKVYKYKLISNIVKTPRIKVGLDKYKEENIIFRCLESGQLIKRIDQNSKERTEEFYKEKIMPSWNVYKKENGYRE